MSAIPPETNDKDDYQTASIATTTTTTQFNNNNDDNNNNIAQEAQLSPRDRATRHVS